MSFMLPLFKKIERVLLMANKNATSVIQEWHVYKNWNSAKSSDKSSKEEAEKN